MNKEKVYSSDVVCWVDRPIGNGGYAYEAVPLNEVIDAICNHLKIRVIYESPKLKIQEDKP